MANQVAFENTPGDIRVPIFTAELNAGPPSYSSLSRQLVIGRAKTGSAAALAAKPVNVGGSDPVAVAGAGSMGADMLAFARARNPLGEIWFLDAGAPQGSPAAALGALTVAGTATAPGVLTRYIAGERYDVTVAIGDTAAIVAAALVAEIGRGYTKFNRAMAAPVTAAVDGSNTGKVNLTANHAGAEGNWISIETGLDSDEVEVAGLTVEATAMTGGTGDVDMAVVLAKLGAEPFDFITCPYASTAQLNAARDFLSDSGSGRWAPLVGLQGHYISAVEGIDNLKGSIETAITKAGEASAGPVTVIAQGISKITDGFSSLTESQQQIAIALGGGAAVAGGVVGAGKIAGKLLGIGGLTTAAVALDGSAAALTAAAIKLGADPKDIASQAKNAAPAGALAALGLTGVTLGTAAGAGFAGYATAKAMPSFAATHGPGGIDPATGAALPANPMEGLGPETPFVQEWWRKTMPTWLGGDAVKVEAGKDAGQKIGEGLKAGIVETAPEVEGQAKSLYERLKAIFADGIKVPVRVEGDGLSGSAGSDGLSGGMGSDDLSGSGGGSGAGSGGSGGSGNDRVRRVLRAGTGAGAGGTVPVGRAGGGFKGGPGLSKHARNVDPRMAAYIRHRAASLGIDPEVALRVASFEGLGGSKAGEHMTPGDYRNGRPTSWGPFQLHLGGRGSVGTEYQRATGHHPSDATKWKENIDFALKWARRHGWAAWYGRGPAGVGVRQGIGTYNGPVPAEMPEKALPPIAKPNDALERTMPQGESSAERMERAADRMADLSLSTRHTVEVLAGPGVKARTKGMSATGSPGVRPNVGVSMPGAEMQNVG